jgi:phage tail sheath protein FI
MPDVTFVSLPDLPDLVALDPQPLDPVREIEIPEQFVECSENTIDDTVDAVSDQIRVPHCDETGYANWARALRLLGLMLRNTQREVQLVAAIPLPADRANTDLLNDLFGTPLSNPVIVPGGISTAFIQLVYPWLQTRGSSGLPQQLESAEGAVIGTLARHAMTQGAFHSAVSAPLVDVYRLEPIPGMDMLYRERGADATLFIDRVTVVGPRSAGRFELFSDVTTSLDPSYRPANINRLIASVVRAARRVGESSVFEPSNSALWAQLEERMRSLLAGLEQAGALLETDEHPAFEVRCDRSTMTQDDIDAGRVIVQIVLNAAQPIETIRVELSVNAGGEVLVISEDLFGRDSA